MNAGCIATYSLALGHSVMLNGEHRILAAKVQHPFRARRLIIRARAQVPGWALFLRRFFGWLWLPLLTKRDDIWMFGRFRPTWRLWQWADRKVQRKALERCYVQGLRIAGKDMFINDTALPACLFDDVRGLHFDLPTCAPQGVIEVILDGYGGPLDVILFGDMLLPAEAEKEDSHGMA